MYQNFKSFTYAVYMFVFALLRNYNSDFYLII